MSRKITYAVIILMVCALQPAFAQYQLPEPEFHEGFAAGASAQQNTPHLYNAPPQLHNAPPQFYNAPPLELLYMWDYIPANIPEPEPLYPLFMLASASSTDAGTADAPHSIRNNHFYLESMRLASLAQDSFDNGDYDASREYSTEAVRYAQLSDEYVAVQLKVKEANDAVAAAKQRLDTASLAGAAEKNSSKYAEAQGFYLASLDACTAGEWDIAIESANNVITVLANTETPAGKTLPAQYTVRTWAAARDCLWNIAGSAWAYNDPFKWKLIYDANKNKMPEPGNPDLIHPGMVLDIPSLKGETRQGMWEPGKSY